jgi:hypothetical protein
MKKTKRGMCTYYFLWRRVWHPFRGNFHVDSIKYSAWNFFHTKGKNPKRIAERLKTKLQKKELGKFYNEKIEKRMDSMNLESHQVLQISHMQFKHMRKKAQKERRKENLQNEGEEKKKKLFKFRFTAIFTEKNKKRSYRGIVYVTGKDEESRERNAVERIYEILEGVCVPEEIILRFKRKVEIRKICAGKYTNEFLYTFHFSTNIIQTIKKKLKGVIRAEGTIHAAGENEEKAEETARKIVYEIHKNQGEAFGTELLLENKAVL